MTEVKSFMNLVKLPQIYIRFCLHLTRRTIVTSLKLQDPSRTFCLFPLLLKLSVCSAISHQPSVNPSFDCLSKCIRTRTISLIIFFTTGCKLRTFRPKHLIMFKHFDLMIHGRGCVCTLTMISRHM